MTAHRIHLRRAAGPRGTAEAGRRSRLREAGATRPTAGVAESVGRDRDRDGRARRASAGASGASPVSRAASEDGAAPLPRSRSGTGGALGLLLPALFTACVAASAPPLPPDQTARQAAEAATARDDWRAAAEYWGQDLQATDAPDARAFREAARARWKLGDEDGAQILLDRGIDRHPDDVGLRMMRGRLLRSRGFRRAAELDFLEVTKLVPEDPEAWFELGRVLLELELPVRAAIYLQQHLRLAGENDEALFLLARACAENGELEAAVRNFGRCLDGEDTEVERLVQAAAILAEDDLSHAPEEMRVRALGWVERALEIDPLNAEASYVRGLLLERRGEDLAAMEAYEHAVEFDGLHLPAMTRLAELYARRGEIARADLLIDRALDLNIAASRRRMLERLRSTWH